MLNILGLGRYQTETVFNLGRLHRMGIYVGCGREIGKDSCGDRQPLSGGAPYSGVVAVRLLGRLGVGKFCGIVSDG